MCTPNNPHALYAMRFACVHEGHCRRAAHCCMHALPCVLHARSRQHAGATRQIRCSATHARTRKTQRGRHRIARIAFLHQSGSASNRAPSGTVYRILLCAGTRQNGRLIIMYANARTHKIACSRACAFECRASDGGGGDGDAATATAFHSALHAPVSP